MPPTRGPDVRAADGFAALVDAWRAYGFPLEVGLTGTALARCLHALGRHDEAARVAADAAEVLSDLGADPLVRAATAQLDPG